jgi:hypothetical protein
MSKVVVLRLLGTGNWEQGFPVTLQIGEESNTFSTQVEGYLPTNLEIPQYYQQWQYAYRRLPVIARINAPTQQEINVSRLQDCSDAAHALLESLNCWLDSAEFRPIKEKLLRRLDEDEPIILVIQTEDFLLRRLPWHLWNFVDNNHQAEVVLSASDFETVQTSVTPRKTLRILVILGNSEGINIESDRQFLQDLPRAEHPCFLVEPSSQEITEALENGKWDILFFAGHSHTVGETGHISINATESLRLEQLKYSLRAAIQQGLKLAIFNSCDGLGLARQLEDLGIPQVIVMREPVPDHVAQKFLKYFLQVFSQGQSIYLAVRKARESLYQHGEESKIPGVSWLPVICQNPATKPLVWPTRRHHRTFILIPAIIVPIVLIFAGFTLLFPNSKLEESPQPERQEKTLVYENSKHGIKFNYPHTWQRKEIIFGNTIARFIPKKIENSTINPEVNIQVNEYGKQMTLDDYTRENVTAIASRSETKIQTSITPIQLANREARKLIYTEFEGSTQIEVMEIWTLRSNTIYVIQYTAPSSQYPQFINDVENVIVNSFELTSND